jgi:hypothetical protein
LHLLLTALGMAGLPWSGAAILAAAGAAFVLGWRFLPAPAAVPRQEPGPGQPQDTGAFGWGDGLAIAALLVFTAGALSLWIAVPDFVYHWGLKGQRFYLARGVDYAYLATPWNWVVHPDYPNLLPELFAATALLARRFDEPAMMLWSAISFALLLAAVREALRRAGASRFTAQATLATLAMLLAAYGIAGQSAGGADWLLGLAVAAALPPLLSPADLRGAAQIGVIAAFAASSKVEGVPLAVSLVGVYAVRLLAARRAAGRPGEPGAMPGKGRWRAIAAIDWRAIAAIDWRAITALVLPLAAAAVPWLAGVLRYHLFQAYNSGPLRLDRLPEVLGAVVAMLGERPWHGFAYGLALLPLLALDRRLRPAAAVIGIQLLFYLYVYLSVRIDAVMLVQASFQRLVLHLLPAVLTGAAIALERRSTAAGGRLTAAAAPAGESTERDTTARRSGAESA